LSKSRTSVIYAFLNYIEKKWGEEEAMEAARTFGYNSGKSVMTKRLQGLGKDRQTAEEMAEYQDLRHALGGTQMSHAYAEYDDEKCMVYRTQCAFHTHRPEGMKSYCHYIIDGFGKAYLEVDKGIVEHKRDKCMSRGDDYCYGGFIYGKSE
jgi:hypothetical protein